MKHVHVSWRKHLKAVWIDPKSYLAALPRLAHQLPAGARSFACDPGHYDFHSSRCVKDLELASLDGHSGSGGVLTFSPNDVKHTQSLVITYYDIVEITRTPLSEPLSSGKHDTLILDEILPDPAGCSHELHLTQSIITIRCRDLSAEWIDSERGEGNP